MSPRVSVVMSVYNADKYLGDSIESILNQSFRDFEFIIIDDGSLDNTPKVLTHYQQIDSRILIYRFDQNRGLSTALNLGIQKASGEYIARMDGDDISLPARLLEQTCFLDQHPEISICGTWVEIIGDKNGDIWYYPTQHEAIAARMFFVNTLVHPSVMMRVDSMKHHALLYDENIQYAQDYELWSRALSCVQIANLGKVLLLHRIHDQSIGIINRAGQHQTHEKVYRQMFALLGFTGSSDDLQFHQRIALFQYSKDFEFLRRARLWLENLSRLNQKINFIQARTMDLELGSRWTRLCHFSDVSPFRIGLEISKSFLMFENSTFIIKYFRMMLFIFRRILNNKNIRMARD